MLNNYAKLLLFGIIGCMSFMNANLSMAEGGGKETYISVKDTKISLPLQSATIEEVFKEIEQVTEFNFAYEKKDLNEKARISNSEKVVVLSDLLTKISKESNLKFKQFNNSITVYKRRKKEDPVVDVIVVDFSITGRVIGSDDSAPLLGVSIRVMGTNIGTITDANGEYKIDIPGDAATLQYSYVGYESVERAVSSSQSQLNITMELDLQSLMDVVVVGSRFNPRSVLSSPVPIDNISTKELETTGQLTLDQMINFRVQSYNASQQTVSDATAHFNPADLRGLGPSRTLVLINGKRKNPSALVYINDTPGKGEVGVDMQSIPVGAIERVEILRDGASAQYGSDAIAGVINVILKDDVDETDINVFAGITTEGDGFNYGFSANTGFNIFEKGFVNVTTSFKEQEFTNRAGKPGQDDLFGAPASDSWIQNNPGLGMIVGQPDMTTFDIFYNLEVPLTNGGEVYSFGGVTYRNGRSFALYRVPHWPGLSDPYNIFHAPGDTYNGFHPTFETDIYDNTLGFGVRSEINGWEIDLSSVTGGNSVEYNIGNSLNPDLNESSPTRFFAGGYEFKNLVNNLDIFRKINDFSLGFGSEFRTENFIATAGEEDSYTGGGVQSFPGIQPANEVNKTRYNVGFYTDIEYDNRMFLIGGAARYEKYGDFGNTFNWKVNSRVRLWGNRLTLRASASTGFRAPSLHQIYLSNVQTLVSGGTVSNQGTFNNDSPVIRGLEVPQLKEEESFNVSAGLAFSPIDKLEITIDYYDIRIKDRVLFTGEIGFDSDTTTTNPVEEILETYNVTSLKFFINAVDTRTKGLDLVVGYKDISLGTGSLSVNFAANFNSTTIEGAIKTPQPIEDAGNEIFNRKEQARIVSARPADKVLLGFGYEIGNLNVNLSFTRFGEVTWRHASNPDNDQTFSAKVITDLNLSYKITKSATFGITVNNLMDVYPDRINTGGDVVTDLGGRFKYPWEVNQFGFLGTVVSGKMNLRF